MTQKLISTVQPGEYIQLGSGTYRVKGTANFNTAFVGLTTELYLEGREPLTLHQTVAVEVVSDWWVDGHFWPGTTDADRARELVALFYGHEAEMVRPWTDEDQAEVDALDAAQIAAERA